MSKIENGTKPLPNANQTDEAHTLPTVQVTAKAPDQPALTIQVTPSNDLVVKSPVPQPMGTEPSFSYADGIRRPTLRGVRAGAEACGVGTPATDVHEAGHTVATRPGDSWNDVARAAYGEHARPAGGELLGSLLAMSNRSTAQTGPNGRIVQVPDFRDANRILDGLATRHASRLGKHGEPGEVTKRLFGDRDLTPTDRPTPGHAYETRWNDHLLNVVLITYRDHLKSLPPEEVTPRAIELMAMVAELNGLNKATLAEAGVIYLPTLEEGRSAIQNRGEVLGIPRSLYDNLVRAGQRASQTLDALGDNPQLGMTYVQLGDAIAEAKLAVYMGRVDRVMSQSIVPWGIQCAFAAEFDEERTGGPNQVVAMRAGESPQQFLERVDPALSPEERDAALGNLQDYSLRRAGLKNEDGTLNEAAVHEFYAGVQGLVDPGYRITPQAGETPVDIATRVILEQVTKTVKIEYGPGEDFGLVLHRMIELYPDRASELSRLGTVHTLLVARYESEPGFSTSVMGPPAPNAGMFTIYDLFKSSIVADSPADRVQYVDIRRSLGLPDLDIGTDYVRPADERPWWAKGPEDGKGLPLDPEANAAAQKRRQESRESESLKTAQVAQQRSVRTSEELVKNVREEAQQIADNVQRADHDEATGRRRGGPKSGGRLA
jgi:hypothetical protein